MKTRRLWEKFPLVVEMVKNDHISQGAIGGGHDFLHALMVAQYADIIAENENVGELAWIAGICHNTDRIFHTASDRDIDRKIWSYLNSGGAMLSFTFQEKEMIAEAIMNHSKLNDPKDNPVTITLKDADRLPNIGPLLCVRSGQHFHNLPACDPHFVETPDPTSSFRDPKTVLRDIEMSLEWEPWLRCPKAIELAKPWFNQLRIFVEGFKRQLEETDLLPYPF